ncbi:HEPN domain-containing protein [Paraclostridium bifermentans]|uniref:ApeA N-terminal domain 1-containing protein n=1 Tax=Paraclostridium bifermentans TaxID=1490 RepID=UPI0011DD2F3B|nr:HEPN domain-containing protein [Paraclostridium bifermentans]
MEDIMITSKKMSDTFEVRGIWSKSLNELDKGISGILKYSSDKITLELIGKISSGEIDLGVESDENFDGSIYGVTVKGEYITLYDCFCSKSTMHFPGIEVESYVVNSLLVGGLHNKKELVFKESSVYFSNLVEWLGRPLAKQNMHEHMKLSYEIDRNEMNNNLMVINIPEEGITIKEGYKMTTSYNLDRIDISSDRCLSFTTCESETLEKQLDNIQKVRKLISFLMNGSVYIEKINIISSELKDYEGKSYNKNHKFSYFFNQRVECEEIKCHEQLLTYKDVKKDIEFIFNQWFKVYENICEAYDLICDYEYKKSYNENVFLNYARSIEVLHRNLMEDIENSSRDASIEQNCEDIINYINTNIDEKNRKYFIDRVLYQAETAFFKRVEYSCKNIDDYILEDLIKSPKKSLRKSISSFSTKVSKTRNYLTHKDSKRYADSAVIKEPINQMVVAYKIKIIVIILIGKYIGIDEVKMSKKLKNSKTYRTAKIKI